MPLSIFFLIVFLMIINLVLIAIVFGLFRQLNIFTHLKKNYSAVVVLQKIMEVIGKKLSSSEKLEEINKILIDENDIMFSTIVSCSGSGGHDVKVSNVEMAYINILEELDEEDAFQHNPAKNVSKYLTSGGNEALRYPSAQERGIRSAMFLPLYLEDVYSGYWLLEDMRPNAFDRFEKVQLSILKNNLVLIIENSNNQAIIEKMAESDRLTGLYNRYYLYSKARNIINDYPISTIAIADIDHFKKFNDTYGHDVGDKVLIHMVKTTQKYLGREDIFVRFGGEEFVILFPGKSPEACMRKIDEIREMISKAQLSIGNNDFISVTVSYGITGFKHGENLDSAIKMADNALYRAKENGRNRVEKA